MSLLSRLKLWTRSRKPLSLDKWFFVTYDEFTVSIRATPPGGEAWEQSFLWSTIERVCFKDEGLYQSDGIYVFTSERPESFVIPTEANGGSDFFGELVGLGLFPAEVMAKAVSSTDGGFYCWPAMESNSVNG
jgi:hypothetical protein